MCDLDPTGFLNIQKVWNFLISTLPHFVFPGIPKIPKHPTQNGHQWVQQTLND